MVWIKALFKGVKVGVGWLIRHPEVIDGGIKVVKGIRKKTPKCPICHQPMPEGHTCSAYATEEPKP